MPDRHRACDSAPARHGRHAERKAHGQPTERRRRAQKEPAVGLKRTLGLRRAITITAGTVIGVGLFTTGGNVVGETGPFVVLATALAALISIYPALMYGEMGAALPFAGGTYQYASLGLGRPAGFLAGWNFIMSLIAVTGGEALAFSYYLDHLPGVRHQASRR